MVMTVGEFIENYAEAFDGNNVSITVNGWYDGQRIIHYRREGQDAPRQSIPMLICEARVDGIFAEARDEITIDVMVDW